MPESKHDSRTAQHHAEILDNPAPRRQNPVRVHAVVGILSLILIGTHLLTGGILQSPASLLMILPPLLAHFLLGLNWGLRYTLLTFLVAVTSFNLAILKVPLPHLFSTEVGENLRPLCFALTLIISGTLTYRYERRTKRLRQTRDHHHRLHHRLSTQGPGARQTGRDQLDEQIRQRLRRHDGSGQQPPFSLCRLHLDGLQVINTGVGDEVSDITASRLAAVLRPADTFCRLGGDEFILLLEGIHQPRDLATLALRLIDKVQEPMSTSQGYVDVSAILGFACFPQHGLDQDSLTLATGEAVQQARRGNGWSLP